MMSLSPEAQVEYSVQQEITRLTNDNLVSNTAAAAPFLIPVFCFPFSDAALCLPAGSQRAGGEAGEEREEAEEAAQDLHEEGPGAGR